MSPRFRLSDREKLCRACGTSTARQKNPCLLHRLGWRVQLFRLHPTHPVSHSKVSICNKDEGPVSSSSHWRPSSYLFCWCSNFERIFHWVWLGWTEMRKRLSLKNLIVTGFFQQILFFLKPLAILNTAHKTASL